MFNCFLSVLVSNEVSDAYVNFLCILCSLVLYRKTRFSWFLGKILIIHLYVNLCNQTVGQNSGRYCAVILTRLPGEIIEKRRVVIPTGKKLVIHSKEVQFLQ